MNRLAFACSVGGAVLLTAACSQPTAQPMAVPTGALATPSGAPAAQATSVPVVASRPAASPSAPGTAAASPGTGVASPVISPAAAPQASAGTVRLTIVPAQSEARYIAREQLAANTIQTDAIGTTKDVSGQIVVDAGDHIASGSRITVSLLNLTSDRPQRDNFLRRNTLQTDQFASAEFVPTDSKGLPSALPTSGQVDFTLLGDMMVHGVTQPATWDVSATFSASDVTGKANTVVRLDTFGMPKPQVGAVLSIDDDIRLELTFTATRST